LIDSSHSRGRDDKHCLAIPVAEDVDMVRIRDIVILLENDRNFLNQIADVRRGYLERGSRVNAVEKEVMGSVSQ
jgi:hypothetical protein